MLVSFAHICIRVKFLGHIFRQVSYVTAEIKLQIVSRTLPLLSPISKTQVQEAHLDFIPLHIWLLNRK